MFLVEMISVFLHNNSERLINCRAITTFKNIFIMTNVSIFEVLSALKKHETLTLPDLLLEENLGFKADRKDVEDVLKQLSEHHLVTTIDGAKAPTYTITSSGIEEEERLSKRVESMAV
jgi:predicted transcriptional regulator